jgi:hypothetical protein
MNTFAVMALLAKKLLATDAGTRGRLNKFIDEAKTSGAIPLGLAKDASDRDVYWWVVWDAEHHPMNGARMNYLADRSPPGYPVAILFI